MSKSHLNQTPDHAARALRQRTEECLRQHADKTAVVAPADAAQLLHELLVHQIELEMQNEELRQAQATVEETRARYFDLYDLAPMGYLTLNPHGLILEANLTATQWLGVNRSNLIKQPFTRWITNDDHGRFYLHLQNLFATGAPQRYDAQLVKKDGTLAWAQIETNLAQGDGASVCRLSFSDLSARTQMEENLRASEARFRSLVQDVGEGITQLDAQGRFVFANPMAEKIFGVPADQLLGRAFREFIAPEFQARFDEQFASRRAGAHGTYELDIVRADGTRRTLNLNATPQSDATGQFTGSLGAIRDVTAQKESERILRRYEILSENARDIMLFVRAADGAILEANRAASEAYGYPRAELLTKKIFDLRAQDTPPAVNAQMQRANQDGILFEATHVRRDGTAFPVEVSSRGVEIDGERILLSIVRDITERKRAEEALRESEQRLQDVIDHNIDGMVVVDQAGLIQFLNPAAAKLLNKSLAELKGQTFGIPIAADHSTEIELRRADQFCIVDMHVGSIHWASQPMFLVILHDMTNHKRAEEKLRESESTFRNFIDQSPDGIIVTDAQGIILEWNRAHEQLTGIPRADALGKYSWQVQAQVMPPHVRARLSIEQLREMTLQTLRKLESTLTAEPPREFVIATPTGESRTLSQSMFPIHSERGLHVGFIFRDMTERKRAEEALRVEKERFEQIAAVAPGAILSYEIKPDGTTQFHYASPGVEKIYGMPPQSLLASNFSLRQFTHPDDLPRIHQALADSARTMSSMYCEYRMRMPNQDEKWVEINGNPIHTPEGSVLWHGFITDVTERKRAENALRESEEKFAKVFQSAPVLITLSTVQDGKYLDVNDEFTRVSGFSRAEAVGKTSVELGWLLPDDRATLIEMLRAHGRVTAMELTLVAKDGHPVHCLYHGEQITVNGQTCLLSIAQDITERKRAEQNLELIAHAARELKATLNLSEIYAAIHRNVRSAMPCDFLFVSDYDAAAQLIRCAYGCGPQGNFDVAEFPPIPLEAEGRGTQSLAIRSGKPLILNDYASQVKTAATTYNVSEQGSIEPQAPTDEQFPRSALIVPLKLSGKVVGVIQTLSIHQNDYSERDLQFLESLALHISTAMQNARLFEQLQNELAERTRAEQTARESEAKFRMLFQNVPMNGVIYQLIRDEQNEIVDWELSDINDLGAASLQQTPAELMGKRAIALFGAETMRPYLELCRTVVASNQPKQYETYFDYNDKYYLSAVFPISTDFYANMAVDITERKRAEEQVRQSEAKYRRMFEKTAFGIFHSTPAGRFLDVNPALAQMMGYASPQEMVDSITSIPDQVYAEKPRHAEILESTTERQVIRAENLYRRKDGSLWNANLTLTQFKDENGETILEGFIEDITERKRAEQVTRAQRDLGLRLNSAYTLAQALDTVLAAACQIEGIDCGGVYLLDPVTGGMELMAHRGLSEVFIAQNHSFAPNSPRVHFVHVGKPLYLDAQSPLLVKDATFQAEHGRALAIIPVLHESQAVAVLNLASYTQDEIPASTRIFLEALAVPVGSVVARSRAESALHESRTRNLALLNALPDMMFRFNFAGVFLDCHAGENTLLVAPEYFLGRKVVDILPPSVAELTMRHLQEIAEHGQTAMYEYDLAQDGQARRFEVRMVASGQDSAVSIVRDITERKRAEENLQARQTQLENAEESAKLGSWELDLANGIVTWSKQMFRHVYLAPQDRAPDFAGYLALVHPEDRAQVENDFKQSTNGIAPVGYIHRTNPALGPERVLQPTLRLVKDNDGKPVKLTGTVLDITERKRAEEERQFAQERYQRLFEQAPLMYVITRIAAEQLIVAECNQTFLDTLGYTRAQVVGRPLADMYTPESRSVFDNGGARRVLEGGVTRGDRDLVTRDGRIIQTTLMSVPETDPQGKIIGTRAMYMDITERKRAEQAMRESEERFRTLYETMVQGVVYQDATGTIISANPAAERILGLSLDQMQGRTSVDPSWRAIHEDDSAFPGETHPAMVALRTGERSTNVVMGVFHPLAGQHTWINVNATPQFRPGETRPYQVYTTFEDITARKQNQDLMRARLRLLEFSMTHTVKELLQATLDEAGVLLNSPIGFYHFVDATQTQLTLQAWSTRTRHEFCNAASEDSHYGLDQAGVWADCARERRPRIHNDFAALTNRRGMPAGHATVIREAVVPILRNERVVAIMGVGNKPGDYTSEDLGIINALADLSWDIVERKRVEEENQKLAALVESSMDFIGLASLDGQIQYLNPSARTLVGLDDSDVTQLKINEFMSPDSPDFAEAMRGIQTLGRWQGESELKHFETGHLVPVQMQVFTIPHPTTKAPMALGAVMLDIMERKIHETQTERHMNQLRAQYQLARALAETDSLEAIYTAVTRTAAELLHVTFARLAQIENDQLVVRSTYPIRDLAYDLALGQCESLALLDQYAQILTDQGILVLSAHDPTVQNHPCWRLFIGAEKTLGIVPIQVSGQTLGYLLLGEERDPIREPFDESQQQLARHLADQAASAIHRAQLSAQTQKRLAQVQTLHAIDTAITNTHELAPTLDVLLTEVRAQLGVDAACVLLFNPETQELAYRLGQGFTSRVVEQGYAKLGESLAGRAGLSEHPIALPDLRNQMPAEFKPFLEALGNYNAYYAVPLRAEGQLKGVIELYHPTAIATDPDWFNFLETLATQAAIALDNTELFQNLAQSNAGLSAAYDATIEGWSRALDLRDNETEGHTQRVAQMTIQLAEHFGFDAEQLVQIRRGALLHDIGKMGIPDAILLKPGTLTEAEMEIMRRHPDYAQMLLSPIEYLAPAIIIPYCHHEKWDGTGYPRGLKGEEIPLAARLFSVIDVWDALISNRPYRAGLPKPVVLEHIRKNSGTQFDPRIVKIFLELFSR